MRRSVVEPPLLDTESVAGGEFAPTPWRVGEKKKKGRFFWWFHLLFIWMLSLLLVCLLSWNSVISLILKFKYMDFYLVYRYLFNFSVGEFECASVWECVMHVAYCMRTGERACGLLKEDGGALGVLMGCSFFRNSRKPFDSFHWVSFGLCFVNQCHCYEV